MKLDVWTSVKVGNADHPRAAQAGTVYANHPDHPDETAVKFDADGAVVLVALADLVRL
jgi:hypothetical protein